MASETHTVTYRGAGAFASMLAQMLEEEGLQVEWEQPEQRRSLSDMAQAYVVSMAVAGSLAGIKLAVDKFRKHAPKAEVEIDDDDEDQR